MAEKTETAIINIFEPGSDVVTETKNVVETTKNDPVRDESDNKTVDNIEKDPDRDNLDVIEDESPVVVAKSASPEEKAREMGWTPQDEWRGDPEEWVDAKEYIARGSFFKKIAKYKQEVEEQRQTLKEVLKTLSQSEERAYKKALKDIEDGKLKAKAARDIDTYEHYINQEKELSSEYTQKTVNDAKKDPADLFKTDEFKRFALTDPYIIKQDASTSFARHTAQQLSNEWAVANPGVNDIKAELDYIKVNMRRIHPPERFPELYRESELTPSAPKVVAPKGGTRAVAAAVSTQGLTPMELHIVNKLKRDGLDWKAYVKELKAQ